MWTDYQAEVKDQRGSIVKRVTNLRVPRQLRDLLISGNTFSISSALLKAVSRIVSFQLPRNECKDYKKKIPVLQAEYSFQRLEAYQPISQISIHSTHKFAKYRIDVTYYYLTFARYPIIEYMTLLCSLGFLKHNIQYSHDYQVSHK